MYVCKLVCDSNPIELITGWGVQVLKKAVLVVFFFFFFFSPPADGENIKL